MTAQPVSTFEEAAREPWEIHLYTPTTCSPGSGQLICKLALTGSKEGE
jgi:hypothetical protein